MIQTTNQKDQSSYRRPPTLISLYSLLRHDDWSRNKKNPNVRVCAMKVGRK